MSNMEVIEEVLALLRDTKPASWSHFDAMNDDDMARKVANWHRVLSPIPQEQLIRAAVLFSRTGGPHLPSPSELFQKALELMDEEPPAEDAWALVLKRIRGQDVELPPRAEKVLVQMGGVSNLQKVDEEKWHRKAFLESYTARTVRARETAALDPSRLLSSAKQ